MAAKTYEVADIPEGLAWAQALLPTEEVEPGKSYELELDQQVETAVVAAGWVIPQKGGKS